MSDFAPELKRFLRQNGCAFVRRGKGDHELWRSPIFPVDHKILSRHTANGVLKQAGLADKKRF